MKKAIANLGALYDDLAKIQADIKLGNQEGCLGPYWQGVQVCQTFAWNLEGLSSNSHQAKRTHEAKI